MLKNPTSWNANEPGRNWHLNAFFGLHYDQHANAQDIELGAELTHEHLLAELSKVKPDWVQCDCKGHPGYTSWPTEVGSTSPGVVRDALRIYRDVTRELGIPLVMHYSGVWDSRAIELHPDWAVVAADGTPSPNATCNLSPYTQELMIPHLIEIIDRYEVDGFWVDGECWAAEFCYCERCTGAFSRETGLDDIPHKPEDANWDLWHAFHRRIFDEHVRLYADAVHAKKPSCTICSNWMFTAGHPNEINVPVDYISGDFTHVWAADRVSLEARFIEHKGLSWDLMAWTFTTAEHGWQGFTAKPAAHLCQEIAVVIAQGGAVSLFDTPLRNGRLIPWHQDIFAEVARFARARQPWCQGTESIPQVAILHSIDSFYAHNPDRLMHTGQNGKDSVAGALDMVLDNHLSADVLTEKSLIERIAEYEVVVVPEQIHTSDALRQALEAYVSNGGRLILTGANVASDFAGIAGVAADGDLVGEHFCLPIMGQATTVRGPYQPVRLTTAEAVANVLKNPDLAFGDTGIPAITRNRLGAGEAIAVHASICKHYFESHYSRTRELMGELIGSLHPSFMVALDAPTQLRLSLRKQEDRIIVHLINMGVSNPTSPHHVMVEEVPPMGPIELRIKSERRPRSVYLAPSMERLSWDWVGGAANVAISSVGIMDSVVIEY